VQQSGSRHRSCEQGFIRDWICYIKSGSPRQARRLDILSTAGALFVSKDIGPGKRDNVRDQLEALIMQMYKSNILYSEAVREFKKRFILTVLQENKGNQCRAARQLDMHRNTLSRTIAELKIDVRQLRDGIKRPPRSARPATYEKKAVR
jgi:Fis family transcriptional regulator, factor for inversion stimulation protein